jgi:D-glycero-alpha-D-manno-heptose-7-phosphate kinase
LGAGGGGFILLFVPPDRQAEVRQAMSKLIHVPFEFEYSGSQVIFFDREEDFEEQDRARAGKPIEAFRELMDG